MLESTVAISPRYKEIIPGTLKEKIDKDVELQRFINNFPNLFLKAHHINTTHRLVESISSRQSLLPQTSSPPSVIGLIKSSYICNPDPTSTIVTTHNSSFTPTFQNLPVNEAERGPLSLEGTQAALDAKIDNLMEDEGINSHADLQIEV